VWFGKYNIRTDLGSDLDLINFSSTQIYAPIMIESYLLASYTSVNIFGWTLIKSASVEVHPKCLREHSELRKSNFGLFRIDYG
jgi:hypothetical protein